DAIGVEEMSALVLVDREVLVTEAEVDGQVRSRAQIALDECARFPRMPDVVRLAERDAKLRRSIGNQGGGVWIREDRHLLVEATRIAIEVDAADLDGVAAHRLHHHLLEAPRVTPCDQLFRAAREAALQVDCCHTGRVEPVEAIRVVYVPTPARFGRPRGAGVLPARGARFGQVIVGARVAERYGVGARLRTAALVPARDQIARPKPPVETRDGVVVVRGVRAGPAERAGR